jgi:hypothetical protein
MKWIQLTKGQATQVDDSDYEGLSRYKWMAVYCRGIYYAARMLPRTLCRELGIPRRSVMMHNELLRPTNDLVVDHRDGDGLNNQRTNLRPATRHQNMQNMKAVIGSSKYKGVHRPSGRNKWVAQIRVNDRVQTLGRFETENEAALAYNAAALKYFGEFARLNIVNT